MNEIHDSKNVVTARIDAAGNVIVGDGNNITVINLKEAAQYKHLEAEIEKLNTRFERTKQRIEKYPDDQELTVELLEIDEERSQKIKDLETIKKEVIKLAEDFARIPINTERLKKAKAHFEKGEFAEARAVLSAEQMDMDLNTAIQREKLGKALQEQAQEDRKNLANEYLILARLTATDFELPDRFEKTAEYFEQSLRAERNVENIFANAYFLQEHNQFIKAFHLYEETLGIRRTLAQNNPQVFLPAVADTLNNLAVLHYNKNELDQAQNRYEEALGIYYPLSQSNPQVFLPKIAGILHNLGLLHHGKNELDQAQVEYEKSLGLRKFLAQSDPQAFLPYLADTLNNLGLLHYAKDELNQARAQYEAALNIYSFLALSTPKTFQPTIGMTLNNLAILHNSKNELEQAQTQYQAALEVYRPLAQNNPPAFLPYLSNTASNLALFYQEKIPDQARSLELVKEALRAAEPFSNEVKFIQDSIKRAIVVIKNWGLDVEEFVKEMGLEVE